MDMIVPRFYGDLVLRYEETKIASQMDRRASWFDVSNGSFDRCGVPFHVLLWEFLLGMSRLDRYVGSVSSFRDSISSPSYAFTISSIRSFGVVEGGDVKGLYRGLSLDSRAGACRSMIG